MARPVRRLSWLAILALTVAIAACESKEVVQSGFLTALNEKEVCINEPNPSDETNTECYRLSEDAEVRKVRPGDLLEIVMEDGRAVSVTPIRGPARRAND